MAERPKARVIVLNYNGAELLEECLPSIVKAAARAQFETRVSVLDNQSRDESRSIIEQKFPGVHFETASANRVLCSYNEYLPKISEEAVILLNNDIRVDRDFIDPLLERFSRDPKTFLVAPRVMSFDGRLVEAGSSKAGIKFGLFGCEARYPGYEKEAQVPSETFSSGFGAFSRTHFLALGGYDSRYLPGIMEDVDLCLRARRAGLSLYYEPRSVVYHMGQASFKRAFKPLALRTLAHRNTFLFMWKNFSGPGFWFQHVVFLPARVFFALLKGDPALALGFFEALRKVCAP